MENLFIPPLTVLYPATDVHSSKIKKATAMQYPMTLFRVIKALFV